MYFSKAIASLLAITASLRIASAALGINCRGSTICGRFWGKPFFPAPFLHNTVAVSQKDPSTLYRDHEHIACVSVSQMSDGYCLFPQGADLTLAQIRPLLDALLAHNCKMCGSVPIHFVDLKSNDPRSGILTINYVRNADCTGNCIPPLGT